MPQQNKTANPRRASSPQMAAQFFAVKRLDHLDIWEQSVVLFVWLHTGARHKTFRIHDSALRRFLKCGRTKLYEALRSCQTRGLVDVTPCGDGWRDYSLCWPNLLDLMQPKEQREYLQKLGCPPGGQESVGSSVIRTADPRGEQPVRNTDGVSNKEESALSAQGMQETSTTSCANTTAVAAPRIVARGGGGGFDWSDWGSVEAGLREFGVCDSSTVVRRARQNGLAPQSVAELARYWSSRRPCWNVGALHFRIRTGLPGDAVEQGWPPSDTAASNAAAAERKRSEQAAQTAAFVVVKEGRRAGRSDDEIRRELERRGLAWP